MRRLDRITALSFALGLAVAAMISVAGATHVSMQAATPSYQLIEHWPELPPGETFGTVPGVAVDAAGNIYMCRRNDGMVWKFAPSGRYLGGWKTGAELAHDLRFDREGFLWLTDRDGHEVKKFRADGTLVMSLGAPEKPFNGADMFHGPADIVFLANGDFLIADGYWDSRLVKFNKDGKYLKSIGAPGRAPGELGLPHMLGLDSQGRIVVSDRCDRPRGPHDERRTNPTCKDIRLQFFDADGHVLPQPMELQPNGTAMTVVGDTIYASNGGAGGSEIVILSARTGKLIDRFPTVSMAHEIAVDATGDNIYYADQGRFLPGTRVGNSGALRRYQRTPRT